MPSSCTAREAGQLQAGAAGGAAPSPGAGAVPAEMSTPGTAAEYVADAGHRDRPPGPHPGRRQLRHQRRGGPGEPAGRAERRHRDQGRPRPTGCRPGRAPTPPIGSRPLTIDGVDRAHTWTEISRRCRSLRTTSSRARWASTGRVAPASFTVRAADSDDTSAVANAARAATVRRADRSSRGPNSVAASPETHHRAGEEQRRHERAARPRVIATSTTRPMNWSIRLSARKHDPLGVAALGDHLGRGVRADPARPGLPVHQPQADPQHLPDPPLGEPRLGVVRHRERDQQRGRRCRRPARAPRPPSTRSAHSHGSTEPSRPSRTMHQEQATAPSRPNRGSLVASRTISRSVRAGGGRRQRRRVGLRAGAVMPAASVRLASRVGSRVVLVGQGEHRRASAGRRPPPVGCCWPAARRSAATRAAARPRPPRRRPARRPRRSGAPRRAGAR